jgi:ERCC4-type nuclease
MSNPIERIYIARSEPASIFSALRQQYEVLVDEDDGIDVLVIGNRRAVVFERKEASDLLRSFIDPNEASGEPRVMAQLRRLQEFHIERKLEDSEPVHDPTLPTLRVLLIERTIGQNRAGYATVDGGLIATKIPYNAIDNFLMVVQAWGIRVARSTSLAHTPARIVSIAEGWLSAEDKEPILMLPKAAPAQLRTPMTFPGVGIKRAKILFKHYTNLRTLLGALIDDDADTHVLDSGVWKKVKAYLDKPITWTDRSGKHPTA